MIKAASAFTFEVDDIEHACLELKKQISEKLTLKRNSVGIVQCNPDFVEAGIMEKLYSEFGIPLAGGTTVSSASNDAAGGMMCSLLVLTADDVEFVVSHTTGLEKDFPAELRHSFSEALAKPRELPGAPLRLALVFPPVIDAIAGDSYVEAIESVCGTVPVFGSLAVDDTLTDFARSASVYNGTALKREMSYILFFGDVNPRFFMATVPKQFNLAESNAVITRADDNVAYEINNMRAIDYFESIGFAQDGVLKLGVQYLPLLLTLPDSVDQIPFVRAILRIDPDGSVVTRGKMFEGAHVAFGSHFGIDVMSASAETITQIAQYRDINAALIFSCIIRQLVIGQDSLRELTQVKDILKTDIPFIASYVCGEISPTSVGSDNNACNRFHNYTFITCLL